MSFSHLQLGMPKTDRSRDDLARENRAMVLEIERLGGVTERISPGAFPPELENAFLKQVLAYEAPEGQPVRKLRALFPAELSFPPAEALSAAELRGLLEQIRSVLGENGVELGLSKDLPARRLYRIVAEELIPHEELPPRVPGAVYVLDGCDGWCEGCSQSEFCEANAC